MVPHVLRTGGVRPGTGDGILVIPELVDVVPGTGPRSGYAPGFCDTLPPEGTGEGGVEHQDEEHHLHREEVVQVMRLHQIDDGLDRLVRHRAARLA